MSTRTYHEFTLDPFQEEALDAIDAGKSVIVAAPTGTGKTLVADYLIENNSDDLSSLHQEIDQLLFRLNIKK